MAVSESGTYPFLGVSALGGMEGGTTHTHTRARAAAASRVAGRRHPAGPRRPACSPPPLIGPRDRAP